MFNSFITVHVCMHHVSTKRANRICSLCILVNFNFKLQIWFSDLIFSKNWISEHSSRAWARKPTEEKSSLLIPCSVKYFGDVIYEWPQSRYIPVSGYDCINGPDGGLHTDADGLLTWRQVTEAPNGFLLVHVGRGGLHTPDHHLIKLMNWRYPDCNAYTCYPSTIFSCTVPIQLLLNERN